MFDAEMMDILMWSKNQLVENLMWSKNHINTEMIHFDGLNMFKFSIVQTSWIQLALKKTSESPC